MTKTGMITKKSYRANECFRSGERHDCVLLRQTTELLVRKALMFFRVTFSGQKLDLCLLEQYPYLPEERHATGLSVLGSPITMRQCRFSGRRVIQVKDTERSVLVVPDFSTHIPGAGYERYLLVDDTDPDCWRRFEYILPALKKEEMVNCKKRRL